MYKKLFIPGPTHVRDEVLQAQTAPMIGHRAKDYSDLHGEVVGKLKKLLYTQAHVYLFASSSTGVMEGAIRQASNEKILNTVCGAFSKRWHEITKLCGVACDKLEVPMGQAISPALVDEALSAGGYDAITLVLNETSTGIMNPVKEIAALIHEKYPDVLILVDAVSGMAGVKIEFDDWGLDVCLAGVQKCFALPPGLTVCAVSDRARERGKTIANRGYYFAWDAMDSKYDKDQTPATPAVSLIYALNKQLDDMFAEGLENRWQRHRDMAAFVQDWARKNFKLYSDANYLSNTVSNIENNRGISIADLNKELAQRGAMISNGYGSLKEKCFRIAHMGDLQMEDMRWITTQIEQIIGL